MAVPKRRKSKSKRDKRRTHQNIAGPSVVTCPQCGESRLPHHACPTCGTYRGKTVATVKES